MAYAFVLGHGVDGTATKATFGGLGSDTIVLTGTGFQYDEDGYLKSGTINKISYVQSSFSTPETAQTVTVDGLKAANLYDDLLLPAITLMKQIGDWSETSDIVSTSANKIMLEMDDGSQVAIKGTGLRADPTKGNVTALEHFDTDGNSIGGISNLHVSLATAFTALGQSYDIYNYLTQGNNTVTNFADFPPRLEGGLGDDILKGGDAPFAVAEYVHTAVAGIIADLGTGKVTGGAGKDKLIDVDGISGSNFNDTLTGRDDAKAGDSLFGNGGKDTISGLAGGDFITGGTGDDKLLGGDGGDQLNGGAGNDVIDAGAGKNDIVSFSGDSLDADGITLHLDKTGSQDLGGWGKDTLKGIEGVYGSAVGDRLFGSGADNIMAGGGGADKIQGLGGNDTLYGHIVPGGEESGMDGGDTMDGGEGSDKLNAGLGQDMLIGGSGKDSFVFQTPPSIFETDVADKIKDFKPQDDTISFNHFGFGDLGVGKLSADALVAGTEAQDGEDRIIYDQATGNVYFDRDGDGTTNEQVLFAVIVNKADLTNADFVGF